MHSTHSVLGQGHALAGTEITTFVTHSLDQGVEDVFARFRRRYLPGSACRLAPLEAADDQDLVCACRYFAVLEMQVIIAVLLRQVSLQSVPGKADPKLYNYFTLNSNFNLFVMPSAVPV